MTVLLERPVTANGVVDELRRTTPELTDIPSGPISDEDLIAVQRAYVCGPQRRRLQDSQYLKRQGPPYQQEKPIPTNATAQTFFRGSMTERPRAQSKPRAASLPPDRSSEASRRNGRAPRIIKPEELISRGFMRIRPRTVPGNSLKPQNGPPLQEQLIEASYPPQERPRLRERIVRWFKRKPSYDIFPAVIGVEGGYDSTRGGLIVPAATSPRQSDRENIGKFAHQPPASVPVTPLHPEENLRPNHNRETQPAVPLGRFVTRILTASDPTGTSQAQGKPSQWQPRHMDDLEFSRTRVDAPETIHGGKLKAHLPAEPATAPQPTPAHRVTREHWRSFDAFFAGYGLGNLGQAKTPNGDLTDNAPLDSRPPTAGLNDTPIYREVRRMQQANRIVQLQAGQNAGKGAYAREQARRGGVRV